MRPRYGGYGGYGGYGFRPYGPVHARRVQAQRALAVLLGKGRTAAPVRSQVAKIAASFWGQAWCQNLERYSDYASRLTRGRTYLRNGSVVHLDILPGEVLAYVSGSELYTVKVKIKGVSAPYWKALRADCVGTIDSLVELLRGDLDAGVMERVCHVDTGLFPTPKEIEFACTCLDWASMCKHVAAVLYGVGVRLDDDPEVLFRLRKVSAAELVAGAGRGLALPTHGPAAGRVLSQADAAAVFGAELGFGAAPAAAPGARRKSSPVGGAGGGDATGRPKQRATKRLAAKHAGEGEPSARSRQRAALSDLSSAVGGRPGTRGPSAKQKPRRRGARGA